MVPIHSNSLVAVGRVMKARGVRGELKVEPLTDFSDRFEILTAVKLELKNGEVKSFEVEKARISGKIVLIKFKGVEDRDTAETLRGAYVSIPRDEVFPLDKNSFYIFELEGMEAYSSDGRKIGSIIRVEKYPANDVLVVATELRDIMVPAVREFVREVDRDKRRIIVDIPEGLPSYSRGSG